MKSKATFSDWIDLCILRIAKKLTKKVSKVGYDQFFDKKDDDLYTFDRRMTFRNEIIVDTVNQLLKPGDSILDAGCGLGGVLEKIPPQFKLFGFDFSECNVQRASLRLKGKANIRQGSLYQIPFGEQTLDLVICLEVIEHIESDVKAVLEINRVLKVGGYCIASVPSTFYWPEYLSLIGHHRHYTSGTFSELFLNAGFEINQFLPKCPQWQRKYMKHYLFVRLQHILLGRLFRQSLYEFKYPWNTRPLLMSVTQKLEEELKAESKADKLSGTTFVVAKKIK